MRSSLIIFFLLVSLAFVRAQCPSSEADLADGGTFSGPCTIAVGANITITGTVNWSSGTLTINGNDGDIIINSGGSLTINGGTVQSVNNDDGDLVVNSGGAVTIANGATLLLDESARIGNGGSITVSGTLTTSDNDIDIDNGGTMTINATGTINSGDDVLVQGTLINNGTVNSDANVTLSSTAVVTNSGTIHSDVDIILDGNVTNSGSFQADDDITLASTGTFTNSGDIHADDAIDFNGTVNNSGDVQADGDIDIDGAMTNTGSITSDDQITVTGTLVSSGDISTDNDFVVDGGSVTIQNGGTLDSDEDLKVYGSGMLTIDAGGAVTVTNTVINNSEADGGGPISQGSFVINGTLTAGDDFTIQNSTPNSSVTGTGTIDIGGMYGDAECPLVGDFCLCVGTGVGPCDASGPLPVELISFSATVKNHVVELRWSTASELNNAFFTIEKAANIEQFHVVGEQIDGQGTVTLRTDYVTTDENPFYGRSYYRLKQTDYNGTFTYSPVVTIDYEGPRFPALAVYPNPSNGEYIDIEVNGLKATPLLPVQIYDMKGQKIFEQDFEVTTPGLLKRRIEFRSSLLEVGLYIVKAGPTLNLTKKIVVVR